MIRKSANAALASRVLEVARKRWASLSSSDSHHLGRSGHENRLLPSFLLTSSGRENELQLPTRNQPHQFVSEGMPLVTTEQLASSPKPQFAFDSVNENCGVHPLPTLTSSDRGYGYCTESSRVARVNGCHGGGCLLTGFSFRKPGRSQGLCSLLLDPWRSGAVRLLSTEGKSPLGSESTKEPDAQTKSEARPRSIEDFKHEEIEGPTVEKDESDTANEVRGSVGELRTFMDKLSTAFIFLGSVQMVTAIWNLYIGAGTPMVRLAQDLAFLLSFIVAYLLRHFGSNVEFFSKIEDRSRLRVLTLSLQVIKALALMFFRAEFVVKVVSSGTLLALLFDIFKNFIVPAL